MRRSFSNQYDVISDLTRCVDKLVLCILRENSKELIIDIGRLVIERNFRLEDSTFKSLVVGLFEHDVLLSKRLYRYSNELGLYSTIEVNRKIFLCKLRMKFTIVIRHPADKAAARIDKDRLQARGDVPGRRRLRK